MRRRLFFFLEKLEIKRSERISISVLMVVLILLSGVSMVLKPSANYDEEQYQELEKVFLERSKKMQQEKDIILARYESTQEVPVSSSASVMGEQDEAAGTADTTDQNQPVELININTATRDQLQKLPGIGPAYSGRIVEWREENGQFTTKDQLLEIKGIGEKRLEKIKPLITL